MRIYLAWLANTDVDGEPRTDPVAAALAAWDYKAQMHAVLRRAPATVNAALAAVSHLALRPRQARRRRPARPARPAVGETGHTSG